MDSITEREQGRGQPRPPGARPPAEDRRAERDTMRITAEPDTAPPQAARQPGRARGIRSEWGQTIALAILLAGLFAWLHRDIGQVRTELGAEIRQVRAEIGQVRTHVGADMQRLEDRIDVRLVRIEGQMSGLSERMARVEGHLGVAGSAPKDGG